MGEGGVVRQCHGQIDDPGDGTQGQDREGRTDPPRYGPDTRHVVGLWYVQPVVHTLSVRRRRSECASGSAMYSTRSSGASAPTRPRPAALSTWPRWYASPISTADAPRTCYGSVWSSTR